MAKLKVFAQVVTDNGVRDFATVGQSARSLLALNEAPHLPSTAPLLTAAVVDVSWHNPDFFIECGLAFACKH